MTHPRALAVASDPIAAAAALEILARGNAVDAVVAGVLAAAGAHAGVLLGPVQLLVGGPGVGLRAIDGRVRQPGRGVQRPRGFLPDEDIPRAARVGVPALPAALATALASFGKSTAAQVAAAGIEQARAFPERKAVLSRLAQRGPAALADTHIATELLHVAGRTSGGVLTEQDLTDLRPAVAAADAREIGARRVATVPWGAEAVRDDAAPSRPGEGIHAVAAADIRGVLAVACYVVPAEGALVEPLGLLAPLVAEPVLRGKSRVRPGDPLPCAAPVALSGPKEGDAFDVALATVQAEAAEVALRVLLRALCDGAPIESAARTADARAIGVVYSDREVTSVGG